MIAAAQESDVTVKDKARLFMDQMRKECKIDAEQFGYDDLNSVDQTVDYLVMTLEKYENEKYKSALNSLIYTLQQSYNHYVSGRLASVYECTLFRVNSADEMLDVLKMVVEIYKEGK